VRIGTAICMFSLFGYATASGFWSAVVWEAVGGLASAFMSGANVAWLTDALNRRGEKETLCRTLGTVGATNVAASIIGGLIGAQVGAVSFAAVWCLAGVSHALALIVSLVWMRQDGEAEKRLEEPRVFVLSLRALNSTPSLRWAIAAEVVVSLTLPFNYFWSPFFETRVGIAGLGWIYVGILCLNGLGSLAIRSLEKDGGVTIPAHILLSGAGLAGIGLMPGLAVPIIFTLLHEFGRGAFGPLIDTYVQERIGSEYRATFGSLQSLIGRGGNAIVLIAVWASAKSFGGGLAAIQLIWLMSGLLMAATAALLWLFRPKEGD
jgi:hypothetical protein